MEKICFGTRRYVYYPCGYTRPVLYQRQDRPGIVQTSASARHKLHVSGVFSYNVRDWRTGTVPQILYQALQRRASGRTSRKNPPDLPQSGLLSGWGHNHAEKVLPRHVRSVRSYLPLPANALHPTRCFYPGCYSDPACPFDSACAFESTCPFDPARRLFSMSAPSACIPAKAWNTPGSPHLFCSVPDT